MSAELPKRRSAPLTEDREGASPEIVYASLDNESGSGLDLSTSADVAFSGLSEGEEVLVPGTTLIGAPKGLVADVMLYMFDIAVTESKPICLNHRHLSISLRPCEVSKETEAIYRDMLTWPELRAPVEMMLLQPGYTDAVRGAYFKNNTFMIAVTSVPQSELTEVRTWQFRTLLWTLKHYAGAATQIRSFLVKVVDDEDALPSMARARHLVEIGRHITAVGIDPDVVSLESNITLPSYNLDQRKMWRFLHKALQSGLRCPTCKSKEQHETEEGRDFCDLLDDGELLEIINCDDSGWQYVELMDPVG